jgi:hypothetical protein
MPPLNQIVGNCTRAATGRSEKREANGQSVRDPVAMAATNPLIPIQFHTKPSVRDTLASGG